MTPLPEFMELNRNLILFLYGLVFYSLGMVLAIQSRSYSRLELARSLKWLASFGIVHGAYEWGHLFLPLQAPNLSEESIQFWVSVQLVSLAISYVSLMGFGLSLLKLPPWWVVVPVGMFATWVVVTFVFLRPAAAELQSWRNVSDALARYFLALPGGLLAAFSLRRYALQRIAPLNAPHIIRNLRGAGIALAIYGLLSGLIVPKVPFFPGNVLNSVGFTQTLQMPPLVFRSAIGLVLAVAIIRALEIFDLEYARQLELVEQQQILAAERERIARELHDGAIQTVYTAGLLVEAACGLAEPESEMETRLQQAVSALHQAIQNLRHNLVELHARPSDKPFKAALLQVVEDSEFSRLMDIDLRLDLPDTRSLSPLETDHVLAIIHEALANALRHAHAEKVWITAATEDDRLRITIQDNGTGIPENAPPGFGMRNMRDRTRILGSQLEVASVLDEGTTIAFEVPWKEEG